MQTLRQPKIGDKLVMQFGKLNQLDYMFGIVYNVNKSSIEVFWVSGDESFMTHYQRPENFNRKFCPSPAMPLETYNLFREKFIELLSNG